VREARLLYDEAVRRMREVREGARRLENLRDRARLGAAAEGGAGLGLEEARGSEPWWMREPAYRAAVEAQREEESLVRQRAELSDLLAAARSLVAAVGDRAGEEGERVRRRIDEGSAAWHMEEWRRAQAAGDLEAAEVHRLAVARLHIEPYREELQGDGRVRIEAPDPPAEGFLFRYVREADEVPRGGPRLLPLPFDPTARSVSVPAGYRDAVASRLAGEGRTAVHPDVPSVALTPEGTPTRVGTLAGPMARDRYARLLAETAYPLAADALNALGRIEAPVELVLPVGRYLLLLRAPGRADLRVPFEVPRSASLTVATGRLPEEREVPAGFVFVPAGLFPTGGDSPPALDPAPPGQGHSAAFLAARFEVTFADYWEFLSDPRTVETVRETRETGLRFVPRVGGQPVVQALEPEGRWRPPPNPERPAEHLNLFDFTGYPATPPAEPEPQDYQMAALSERLYAGESIGWGYLAWRTERSRDRARLARDTGEVLPDVVVTTGPDGAPDYRWMRFSLPTVEEWERMARGGDRREFPFGDEREWPYFKGDRSRRSNSRPEPVGLFPDDESPFGIRDLTGSVAEWTADWKEVGNLFWVKGSSWASQDPEDARVASRQAFPPAEPRAGVGFRVVVRETMPLD
jgi:formylglycine-generating enzyme required for sulfatase activity